MKRKTAPSFQLIFSLEREYQKNRFVIIEKITSSGIMWSQPASEQLFLGRVCYCDFSVGFPLANDINGGYQSDC